MLQDTTVRVCYRFEAASFHQRVAFHSEVREHKLYRLDGEVCNDLGRRRKHVELVGFSNLGCYKATIRIRDVQCIKKRSTVRKVRIALGSIIFEHCNPTVIQFQVAEATIQGFLNIRRIMPRLSAMDVTSVYRFSAAKQARSNLQLCCDKYLIALNATLFDCIAHFFFVAVGCCSIDVPIAFS